MGGFNPPLPACCCPLPNQVPKHLRITELVARASAIVSGINQGKVYHVILRSIVTSFLRGRGMWNLQVCFVNYLSQFPNLVQKLTRHFFLRSRNYILNKNCHVKGQDAVFLLHSHIKWALYFTPGFNTTGEFSTPFLS